MAALPTVHQRSIFLGMFLSSVFWVALILAGLKTGKMPYRLSIPTRKTNDRALGTISGKAAMPDNPVSTVTDPTAGGVVTDVPWINSWLLQILESTTAATRVQERVLILAVAGRTGSSFVGQLLGANEDTFYLFEPGITLKAASAYRAGGDEQVLTNLYLIMLRDLFQCDFGSLDFYLRYLSQQNMVGLQHKAPRLYDVCTRRSPGTRQCRITQDMAAESCRTSKYIVVKSIRIPDMNLLLPMTEDRAIGLKVIHLVRDPRPMVASSVAAFGLSLNLSYAHFHLSKNDALLSGAVQGLLGNYCKYNWGNLQLGTRKPSLQDRYLFLRYEDAARDPSSAAGRMYAFLGLDHVPESVAEWIETNTKSWRPGIYSTTRISVDTYRAWRRTIPFKDARAIEGLGDCRGMMTRMGYRLLEDEQHLRNMSRSLVGDMPPAEYRVAF